MSNRENLSLARNDISPPSNLLPFHLNGEEVYTSSFFLGRETYGRDGCLVISHFVRNVVV